MCGIAGYIGKCPIDTRRIDLCLERMKQRGPNDSGTYYRHLRNGQHVYLLHSRLSIIDLDKRSAQPMRFGGHVLSYNGELYNYLELKQDFEDKEHYFATTSDTEVMLRKLAVEGIEALDAFEGMWAFAWLNTESEELFLCRDRFGEKPLYLLEDKNGLYFGSEIKFLFALSDAHPRPNLNHLRRYQVNGYKALYKGNETFFENIREVPSGTYLSIKNAIITKRNYWKRLVDCEQDMSFEKAVEETRKKLIRSMELRLRADVPLAFCMSGGIDSNSLICTAKRVFGYDVHGFTIMNTDARYEEKELVETVTKDLGLKHTGIPLSTESFLDNMRQLIRYHDSPISTISYYVHWMLMKEVSRSGYKVSISGTAADELFTGYYDHQGFYLQAVSDSPQLYTKALKNWNAYIKPIIRNPYLQAPDRFVKNPDFRDHIFLDASEMTDYLTTPWAEAFAEETWHSTPLRNRMLNELFRESVPVILHEDDLNAMFFSIENRSPFLDRELFEFSQTIPTQHLIQDGKAKAVLREAMRGIVPDPVLDCRRKVGFNAPILELLDTSDPEVRSQLLEESPVFEVINRAKIENLLNMKTLPNSWSKFLFNFINIKIFLEEFGA